MNMSGADVVTVRSFLESVNTQVMVSNTSQLLWPGGTVGSVLTRSLQGFNSTSVFLWASKISVSLRGITKVCRSKGYLEVQGYITLNCTYLVCIWYLMTFTDNIISTFIGFLSWHIATVMAVGWTVALSRWYRVGHWDEGDPGVVITFYHHHTLETFNLSLLKKIILRKESFSWQYKQIMYLCRII